MLVLVLVLVVVTVGLALSWSREARRRQELESEVTSLEHAVAQRDAAVAAAGQRAVVAERARDDALERATRAKREATEVARRLDEERRIRAETEAQHETAEEERRQLEAQLAARTTTGETGGTIEELWQLALSDAERTWKISVSPTPALASPLEDTDDPLRVAVEIEVDAAREDAGSVIELRWVDEGRPPPAVALPALSIARALVAELAKVAEDAELTVTASAAAVRLEVVARDESGASLDPTVAPEHRIGAGTYLVAASAAADDPQPAAQSA